MASEDFQHLVLTGLRREISLIRISILEWQTQVDMRNQ